MGLLLLGAVLLLGYGSFLNLAPVEFGRIVGLYMGGGLVVAGGLIITFWQAA